MNTTSKKLAFEFDAVDKRHVQISTTRLTASDILIHARMLNECKYYAEQGKSYTPSHTMLAAVGRYAGRKPVIASLKRLEDCGLIKTVAKVKGCASSYLVFMFDDVQGLLTEPTLGERRHESMPLEKRGYKVPVKEIAGNSPSDGVCQSGLPTGEDASKTHVPESSRHMYLCPQDSPDLCPEDSHERTLLKNKKELKEADEKGQNLKTLVTKGLDGIEGDDKQNSKETDKQNSKETDKSTSDRETSSSDRECASIHSVSAGLCVVVTGKPVLTLVVDNTCENECEPLPLGLGDSVKTDLADDDEPLPEFEDDDACYY